jgi:hypothetical protein
MRGATIMFVAACGSSHPSTPRDAVPDTAADAARDAPVDVPAGSGCQAASFQGQATAVGTATSLSIALPSSLAFAVGTPNGQDLYEEQPPSGAAVAIAAFASTSTVSWDHPALRPDGNELFARETNTNTIWSSTYTAGAWGAPVQETGSWFSDSLASTPAAAGASGDLRMMIWDDVQMQEYTRTSGTWTAVGSSLASMALIGQAANLASPQLSPDGLFLVFIANPGGPSETVWFTHRADMASAWALPATAIHGPATGIYSPYLTADCAHLYLVENDKLVRY